MTRLRSFILHNSPFIILAALWLLFFWRYFIPTADRVTFPDGDFTLQFFVFRDIAYRAIAQGHLPLWANCLMAGYPFQADPQSQLFYPPIWISFSILKLLGWGNFPLIALTIEATSHYLLASIFTFLFLRAELSNFQHPTSNYQSPITNYSALLGAIVFTYGGFLTSYPPLQTGILETATWLPLILLSLRKLAQSPISNLQSPITNYQLRFIAFSSLLIAIAFFAGHPQTFFLIAYLAIAYFIHRASVHGRSWRWTLTRLAAMFGLAIGVTLIQSLPQVEYLTLSTRASLTFEKLAGGFPLTDIVQFFVFGIASYWSPLFVGVFPFALVAIAVATTTNPSGLKDPKGFWLIVAIIGLIISFGLNSIGYDIAYWILPGARLFRGQERTAILVAFSLSTLSAFGAHFLLSPLSRSARVYIRAAMRAVWNLLPFAIAVLIFIVVFRNVYPNQIDLRDAPPKIAMLIIGLTLTALTFFARTSPLSRAIPFRVGDGLGVRVLFIGITVLELFTANIRTNAVPLFDPYPHLPLIDPIRNDETSFFRVQDDARMQGHYGCGYGLNEWASISPIRLASWENFDHRAPEALRWKMLGIKYLITEKGGAITREGELPSAVKVAEGKAPLGDAKVYQLFEIPRRAWMVREAQIAGDADSVYKLLSASIFDPFKTVIVRQPIPDWNTLTEPSNVKDNIEIVEDYPGYIKMKIANNFRAMLIFNEAYYPGWWARVNGQTQQMVEANGFIQAVPVPAGDVTVEIYFMPLTLVIGAIFSVLSLGFALFLIVKKHD
ncbi:MAG: YfhO family protein [Chloroflexi bacterium]|nr:YfhO family protein [Chloroflexota bacterium]